MAGLLVVAAVVRWCVGWVIGGRVRRLLPPFPQARQPRALPFEAGTSAPLGVRVSVVVPARNEERLLPLLLDSLATQRLAPHEVIVVDDGSADATAQVAAAGGATVVHSPGPPQGWTGKTYACALGAQAASGDLLVFLDADTVCSPDLLARVVAAHHGTGGVVTVQPYHRMERPSERASAIFNLVAVMGIGARSVLPGTRITGAFGPCLAIGRADYDRIGGHAAVRASVLDDVALARRAAECAIAVHPYEGVDAVSLRMYPEGLRALIDGWSKNFAAGARTTPVPRFAAIFVWLSGMFEAAGMTLAWALGVDAVPAFYPVAYLLFAAQLAWMLRPAGNFGPAALVFPLLVVVFLVVFVRSLWWLARGRVRWKGRVVPTRPTGR